MEIIRNANKINSICKIWLNKLKYTIYLVLGFCFVSLSLMFEKNINIGSVGGLYNTPITKVVYPICNCYNNN